MNPELIVIDSLQGVLELQNYIQDAEYVAFDCETTGLNKTDEIIGVSLCASHDKAFYIIMARWDVKENRLLYPDDEYKKAVITLIYMLQGKKLIMHNAIFDCTMTEAFFKVNLMSSVHTDTMVLAHLLDENRRVGLKELASSIFGEDSADEAKEMKQSVLINGGKLTKDCYEMYKADPYVMGKYGAKDALLTYKLFYELVPQLYEQGLEEFFYDLESMPLLRGPTYDLNSIGLTVNRDLLESLGRTLVAECEEAKSFIYKEIKEKVNLGSPQQLSKLLFGTYGLEFGTLTKAGKNICKDLGMKLPYTPSAKRQFIHECEIRVGQQLTPDTIVNGKVKKGKKIKEPWAYIAADKNVLAKLAPKYKWIAKLLEYQKKQKLLNTYVKGIESRIQYGIVTASYLQHGTLTGRYASRNPNLMNLPREDQRIKECFVARPGKVFVSADYSQLEPRVFSYYSKDTKLMAAFTGEIDFYSVVGQDVHDITDCEPTKESFGKKYKDLRQDSKVIALASAYGATPNQLAPTMGKSVQETEELMGRYFQRFPGVRKMMVEAHDLAKIQGYITNLFGRRRRLPDALKIQKIYGKVDHWDLPYDARRILNMACNFRIQSTGASLINRAAIKFYNDCKELGIDAKIVSQIHDELVIECLEADANNVSLLLQNAMESTNLLEGVPLEAVPRITRTLAK